MTPNPRLPTALNGKRRVVNPSSLPPLVSPGQLAALNNATALRLPKWRAALAKAKAGVANARYLTVGDSITSGSYSNNSATGDWTALAWPKQLAAMLSATGVPADAHSFFGFGSYTRDARIAIGSWANWGFNSVGGNYYASSSATGPLAFTPAAPVDTFVVWFTRNNVSAGTLAYNVNGGSAGTQSQAGTSALASVTITCPLGVNTLNLTNSTGTGFVYVTGIEAYDSTRKCVNVLNAGWAGSTTADWTTAVLAAYDPYNLSALSPDLTVIQLGSNDMNVPVNVGAYAKNLQTLVTAAKVTGDVVLQTFPPSVVATYGPLAMQAQYYQAILALAAANNVPVVDVFGRWVSYELSSPLGYYSTVSPIHPQGAGLADIAQANFNVIGNP